MAKVMVRFLSHSSGIIVSSPVEIVTESKFISLTYLGDYIITNALEYSPLVCV